MAYSRSAVHRSIIVVDVESFGDRRRTNAHQVVARDGLYRALETAFSSSGIPWGSCYQEDQGDGVLILLSPDVPKSSLTEQLPHALISALREHNGLHNHEGRIRLRMVLHAGEVNYDDHGVTGASVTHAFRILEAPMLKSALAESKGVLAVAASSWFYDEVVRHSMASNPDGYRVIQVSVKETSGTAWIYLPDSPHSATVPSYEPDHNLLPANEQARGWTRYAMVDHDTLFGIEDVLRRLSELMDNQDGDRVISIFGAPGAGKTTLAYEAVKRYAGSAGFHGVAWISAKLAQLTSLGDIEMTQRAIVDWKDILFDITHQLHLDVDPNPILVEREFERALESMRRCLIVIDNLETVQDAQFAIRFLEKDSITRSHKVILTSRQSVMPHSRRARELRWEGLTPSAAYKYAKYLLEDDPTMGLSTPDLDKVVRASECNPLLIKLIIRLAMFERRPIGEIVGRLGNVHANLGESVASYLYADSLSALDSRVGTEAAVKLMNVFCSRAPGESFTTEEFYRLSRFSSRDEFDYTKAAACQLALVRALQNNTQFTVHSLLREFVCSEPP